MKTILFSLAATLVSAGSYFTTNSCADMNVVLPSNASKAIIYTLGDEEQQTVFNYNLFQSELTAGTSTQGNMGYIRDGDYNTQCGVIAY
jgi:uncharacterized protein (UPF0333 family)